MGTTLVIMYVWAVGAIGKDNRYLQYEWLEKGQYHSVPYCEKAANLLYGEKWKARVQCIDSGIPTKGGK